MDRDYTKEIAKLKISLEEKSPALLLGAGFSCGAVNHNGEKVPMAQKLVEKLYGHMFLTNPPDPVILEEDRDDAKAFTDKGDLRGLCSLVTAEKRKNVRDDFFTDILAALRQTEWKSISIW